MSYEYTPLDLPEIRLLVGSFLSRRDLSQCARVCKSWSSTFAPLVWQDTVIQSTHPDYQYQSYLCQAPPRALIRSHAHLIRSLVFEGPISNEEVFLGACCSRLEHLSLSVTVSGTSSGPNRTTASTHGTTWAWLQDADSPLDADNDESCEGNGVILTGRPPCPRNDQTDTWSQLAALICQNQRTLRALDMDFMYPPPAKIPTRAFWDAVVKCFPSVAPDHMSTSSSPSLLLSPRSARLTTLSLKGREIRSGDLMLIWRSATPHLKRLEFSRCLVEYEPWTWFGPGSTSPTFGHTAAASTGSELLSVSTLRHLTLIDIRGMDLTTQFAVFIGKSPRLESLIWRIHRSHQGGLPSIAFEEDLHHCQWTELEDIEITSEKESAAVSDRLLSALLDNCSQNMNRLNLCGMGGLQEQTLRSLEQHLQHLQILDLSLCSAVTGAVVQQILSSSPQLESITANSIHALDILNGELWVCMGLRSWKVFIDLSPPTPSSSLASSIPMSGNHEVVRNDAAGDVSTEEFDVYHNIVYERLSTLIHLEHLGLNRRLSLHRRGVVPIQTLDWQLTSGLEQLSTLKELSTICLSHQTVNMSRSAVVWMVEQFPKLRSVSGRLGARKADSVEFSKMFRAHGIEFDP
ncbi:hypothetical protein EDD21DRAFT_367813 [Dissophora ornata]|nr:hypothetical protein EDD21DRAFT_367813 [Dissophora ornata]